MKNVKYRDEIISLIIKKLKSTESMADLSDIGNLIGIAIGSVNCEDGKDKNMLGFEKDSFIDGYLHGYSLKDGTHG